MINISPSQNTKLYGIRKSFEEIVNLYNKKILPTKILLSGKNGSGKSTMAYHIINYILSSDEKYKYDQIHLNINEDNRSFKLVKTNSHPNFYLIDIIDEKKTIDIAQIREMISYSNKSSFNGKPRFVLIDNVENLNKNSVNALLKILEEPPKNTYFILIHNSERNIISTLKSRCLLFKISYSFNRSIEICNSIIGQNILDLINHDLINFYNTPGDLVKLIKFAEEKKINLKEHKLIDFIILLINNSYYKKNKYVKNLIINLIELYFLNMYKISSSKNSMRDMYSDFIIKNNNTEKFNLDEENLFLQFKSKIIHE